MKVPTHGLAKWANFLAGIHLATSGVFAGCPSKLGMQLEYGARFLNSIRATYFFIPVLHQSVKAVLWKSMHAYNYDLNYR